MWIDSSAFIETRKVYNMEEQIIKGRIGVMSLSSTEFAGLWGSPWGGDQQALGRSAF